MHAVCVCVCVFVWWNTILSCVLRRHMHLSFGCGSCCVPFKQTGLPFVSLHFHSSNKQLNVRAFNVHKFSHTPAQWPTSMSTHNKFTLIAHMACYLFVMHTFEVSSSRHKVCLWFLSSFFSLLVLWWRCGGRLLLLIHFVCVSFILASSNPFNYGFGVQVTNARTRTRKEHTKLNESKLDFRYGWFSTYWWYCRRA